MLHWSTALLLVATPGVTILSRLSRAGGAKYDSCSVNACAEILKLLVASIVHLCSKSEEKLVARQTGVCSWRTWLLCCIPGFLYFFQNIAVLEILTILPASTYLALSNTKVLFTALGSRVLLNMRLSPDSFNYLTLLVLGAAATTAGSAGERYYYHCDASMCA
jgi:drug/metabolite transporter (DMT)-like permease